MSTLKYATQSEAKSHGSICGHSGCQVTGAEKELFYCGGCKYVQYCSQECQRSAWKHHKIICQDPTDAGPLEPFFDAIQLHPIKILRDWCRRLHGPIVDWACFNAYELKRHPERCATHVFVLKLQRTNEAAVGSGDKIGKMFRVAEAYLVSREALIAGGELPDPEGTLSTMKLTDQELASREGETRPTTRMVVLWDALCYYAAAMWDPEEIEERSEIEDWKTVLQSFTEEKGEYEMVQGNPVRK